MVETGQVRFGSLAEVQALAEALVALEVEAGQVRFGSLAEVWVLAEVLVALELPQALGADGLLVHLVMSADQSPVMMSHRRKGLRPPRPRRARRL
mmetsp:Transcript_140706/g.449812  ORF Transcript_140706/g.449812 Transcript_140706/m.449812 type:complete len:95 (+) Transcript_140706:671-955(+)